jgi:hypothetical protein
MCADCLKTCEPRPPGALRAFLGLYGTALPLCCIMKFLIVIFSVFLSPFPMRLLTIPCNSIYRSYNVRNPFSDYDTNSIRPDVIYRGARDVTLCTDGPHVVPHVKDAPHWYRTQHVAATLALVLCSSDILFHLYRFTSYPDAICRDLSQYFQRNSADLYCNKWVVIA